MPDPDRDPATESDIRYDNWPLERHGTYADWDVQRATPRQEDGTTEKLAEEYESELVDDDVEWIGFAGGTGAGSALLYSQREAAVYEGDLDEEEERVILRKASRHEVDEESLGEHIEDLGEEHGWEWLSSFAREYLEDDEYEPAFERRDSEFQQRNVAETDLYDLAFFGSHTFVDESDQVHTIDRFFDVYLDENGSTVTRVEVNEEYLIAEEPAADRRAGDADMVDENEREIDVHVDTEKLGGEGELAERLEEWHMDHVGWQRER